MLTEFEKLLNENDLFLVEGNIVNVLVVKITNKSIIVDLNFKSTSKIDIEEFKDFNGKLSVAIGDYINVLIEKIDDGDGNSILSYQKAQEKVNQTEILKSFNEENSYIEVTGKKMVNKGYIADYKGSDIFIPFSLMDTKKEIDFNFLNNNKFMIKIIKCDFDKNSIFGSRKYYIEKEMGIDIKNEFLKLKTGDILKARVKNFMKYGAFVNIGFTDSLLHINDISWRKIQNPREVLSENQEIEVIVTDINHEKQRVFVSLKDLNLKPWEIFIENVSENDTIPVVISNVLDNGIIVSHDDNIDFFIHYSELSWISLKNKIETMFNVGQNINVIVDSINQQTKNVSLKLENKSDTPNVIFANSHQVGDIVNAVVVDKISKFLKIKIQDNVYGYLFGEDLSWNFDSVKLLANFNNGDKITVAYKSFEKEKQFLKFSIKDTQVNPFLAYKNIKRGEVVNVLVVDSQKNLIIVETENGAKTIIKNEKNNHYSKGSKLTLKLKKSTNNSIDLEF